MLRIALLVNPVAGIGGLAGLKGSDGTDIQKLAARRGGRPRGVDRARRALLAAASILSKVRWLTWGGAMGADVFAAVGTSAVILGHPRTPSSAADTVAAARELAGAGADLLVFSGGDGTARDIYDAVGQRLPVLGIPAGVKMHSGVFAATPEGAGEVVVRLVEGGLVSACRRDVRDLDESQLRTGTVVTRFYGELLVAEPGGFLQHTKISGTENEDLAVAEIVAEVLERVQSDGTFVLGPGSTVAAIKAALGMDVSLLGVDVWEVRDGKGYQLGKDVSARWLESKLPDGAALVLSFTRGQGFVLGRGNQQLSARVLAKVNRDDCWIVGTRSKLKSLEGRPLLVDTDDPATDEAWRGLIEVNVGYDDRLWYRVDTRPATGSDGGSDGDGDGDGGGDGA